MWCISELEVPSKIKNFNVNYIICTQTYKINSFNNGLHLCQLTDYYQSINYGQLTSDKIFVGAQLWYV